MASRWFSTSRDHIIQAVEKKTNHKLHSDRGNESDKRKKLNTPQNMGVNVLIVLMYNKGPEMKVIN